jgi:uncharacterized membrane protein
MRALNRDPDRNLLLAVIALGTAIRIVVAFTNRGVKYDVDSAYIVAAALKSNLLHVYDTARWPYPGGFFPILLLTRWTADVTGLVFYGVVKLPLIAADAGLALAVWWGAIASNATVGSKRAATALVALGPSFILISGFHAQMDPAAILPAVIAVLIWVYDNPRRRALKAGVLIGIGASFKSVPLFMLLALLPTANSNRERMTVIALALAIPAISILPFLIADGHTVQKALTANQGVPGWGGISLFAQPRLIHYWLHGIPFTPTQLTRQLTLNQNKIVLAAVLIAGAVAYRKRMPPITAAALIWAAVYVANPNWSFQYFIWGLPFFLLAGLTIPTAIVQALLALPAAELYFRWGVNNFEWAYLPLIYAAWLWFAATGWWLVRRHAGQRPATRAGGQTTALGVRLRLAGATGRRAQRTLDDGGHDVDAQRLLGDQ